MKVKLIISAFSFMLIGVAAVNVHLSLKSEMPLSGLALANFNALAYAEGGNEVITDSETGNSPIWIRTDMDCVYEFSGTAGAQIKIFGGTVLTIGADGKAVFKYPGGKTICQSGGNQQCHSRYCPSPF